MNMSEFIAQSEASKNALNMATLASTLPVMVLIFGEVGVGKKSLARVVAPDAVCYDAKELQKMMSENSINLQEFEILILSDIDRVNNIKQFIEKLEKHHIKVIATATQEKESFGEKFAVRIDILPLSKRKEDLQLLSQNYLNDANRLFSTDVKIDDIEMDFSKNSISLRESIYRGVLFNSIDERQIKSLLEVFLLKQMDERTEYKDLLEIFEIPLIKACRAKFKSQLQMASALNINRNTLRKKINQYDIEV
jgi:DNA-binding NtrC family response regulator